MVPGSTATAPGVKHVVVETIAHRAQRYDTVGDWVWNPVSGTLYIYVSDLGDWRANMAVALHEQYEAMLCIQKGITQQEVEDWDLAHPDSEDPGMDPDAPYHYEHWSATEVERQFIYDNGMYWEGYEDLFKKLPDWAGHYVPIEEHLKHVGHKPIYEHLDPGWGE